jgi:hypothetical protein
VKTGCARARRSIVERGLGRLSAERSAELARHLAGCSACSDAAADEAQLTARLAALALGEPPAIDVRARVLREIATRKPAAELVPVGWAAAAAALAVTALLGWSVAAWPELRAGMSQACSMVEALVSASLTLVSALAPIGGWLLDLGHAAARALGSLAPLVRASVPVFTTLLVVGATAAMTTIALAVARDLARPRVRPVEEP